jgi:trk system potassium uptake protein TrkH
MKFISSDIRRRIISPERFIPVSFLVTIILGTVLLTLPISSASGQETSLLTALFTATTSVCVTGLVVVDTYAHWSLFGQFVIMVLVQIGGLGVVAVGSMLMLVSKKKFSLGDRMLLGDALNVDLSHGLLGFLIRIFKGTFIVEGVAALLYALAFIPRYGFGKGLWSAIFQAVSAFCNAGMDVIGPNSMIEFRDSGFLMGLTMALIVMGGIGFVVWFDIIDGIKNGIKHRQNPIITLRHLPEHTKLVLLVTAILLVSGTAGVFAAEYSNPGTIGDMSLGDKLLNSLFQSVTFRTAGFASIPQENLTEISCVIGYILMFIGGSPVGTAGGVKTVTAFLVVMNAISYINGKKEDVIFHRKVSAEMMRKAAAIVTVSASVVFIMTMLLLAGGNVSLTDGLYEIMSALGTVGLTRGLTPSLSAYSRVIVIISMYLGRIGPISLAVFFAKNAGLQNKISHSEGMFYVG